MFDNNTEPSSMRMTAAQFIESAWRLDFSIVSADSDKLDANFVAEVTMLAKQKGIDVQYLNFSQYSSPVQAI